VSAARGGAEDRSVRQVDDHFLETLIALEREMLCVLVANGAETAAELMERNAGAAEAAMGLGIRG
jgi:hypothetical protein